MVCATQTISFNLLAVPLGSIVVNATIVSPNGTVVSPSSRTYTTANWATGQTFTVDHGTPSGTSTITFSATGQVSQNSVVTITTGTCL